MSNEKQTCATCRYWASEEYPDAPDTGEEECRRYPPKETAVVVLTPPEFWCGEWQAKSRTPPAPAPSSE